MMSIFSGRRVQEGVKLRKAFSCMVQLFDQQVQPLANVVDLPSGDAQGAELQAASASRGRSAAAVCLRTGSCPLGLVSPVFLPDVAGDSHENHLAHRCSQFLTREVSFETWLRNVSGSTRELSAFLPTPNRRSVSTAA